MARTTYLHRGFDDPLSALGVSAQKAKGRGISAPPCKRAASTGGAVTRRSGAVERRCLIAARRPAVCGEPDNRKAAADAAADATGSVGAAPADAAGHRARRVALAAADAALATGCGVAEAPADAAEVPARGVVLAAADDRELPRG